MRTLAIGIVFALPFAADGTATDGADRILDVFLSNSTSALTSYRAVRTLEASTRGGRMRATLKAITSLNPADGFQYVVVDEAGSAIIRTKVLRAALDAERQMSRDGTVARGAISSENYEFVPAGEAEAGVVRIDIHPKRKDAVLIEGGVLLAVDDADLLQVEGTLVKRPSFWTRRVDVVRRYGRVSGVRVPVEMRSTADVLLAGKSTFTMTYDYEMINGKSIGASPVPVSVDPTSAPADVESNETGRTLPTEG